MKLAIFGLGYVGCVSAACFADAGAEVIGVDVNEFKVDVVSSGRSPIIEPGVERMMAHAVEAGRLRATVSGDEAVAASDVSLVCVGTPGKPNGSLDLTHVQNVCQQIGTALASKDSYHIVVVRSTMLPGTVAGLVVPTLEEYSGRLAGRDFGVAINPEFLREGTAVADFNNAPFTLIGADDDRVIAEMRRLYEHLDAPVVTVGVKEAEMVKYACNCFHATKVTFANEIGSICKAMGVDSHQVMDVFCRDTKLNLSPAYLRPGFAFGGSCLPKDLRAVAYRARELDVDVPLLSSVLASNRLQIERAVDMVLRTRSRRVGVLGLSFKAGTDDLRESPMVTLIEALIGKGLSLAIYDPDVELGRTFGANKEYIERAIPHISSLMSPNLREVIDRSEVVVVGKKNEDFREPLRELGDGRIIVDLVRFMGPGPNPASYNGICW